MKPWGWIFLGSAFLFVLVWEQVQCVRLGYAVESLRAQAQGQEQKNAYLRLELERLRSPEWISGAARERLRMAPPSPESVVILNGSEPADSARLMLPSVFSRLFFASKEQH